MDKATSENVFGKAGSLTGYWGAKAFKRILFRADYVRPFTGQTKKLAQSLSEAMVELGRITTSMQFLDNFKGAFLQHRATMSRLEKLSKQELEDAAASSLDFVTNLLLKWQSEGIMD